MEINVSQENYFFNSRHPTSNIQSSFQSCPNSVQDENHIIIFSLYFDIFTQLHFLHGLR